MRVIAGTAKGRSLSAPPGLNTRPITSKIKAALFSIWQTRLNGARLLDLFSGSGSIGIEALSRGASSVVFVERDKKAIEVIRSNLALCKFTSGFEIYQDDVFNRIKKLNELDYKFDIIYLDPPFTVDEVFLPVMQALADNDILAPDGIIAIRTLKTKSMPDSFGRLTKFKLKNYGLSNVHFYHDENE